MALWETASRPRTLTEVCGHDATKTLLKQWLAKEKRKPALLCGPTGTGKTCLGLALLSSYSIWDDSLLPEGQSVCEALDVILYRGKSLQGTRRAILLDLEGIGERAGILKKIKGEHFIPVILTCDDAYDFRAFKGTCDIFVVARLSSDMARLALTQCSKRMDIPLSIESAGMILEASQGNVRNAVNTLQMMVSTKKRKRTETTALSETSITDAPNNLFADAGRLCCGYIRSDAYELAAADSDMTTLMLHQNVVGCSKSLEHAAVALDRMSAADLLNTRYLTEYATYLTVGATAQACRGSRSTKLEFPSYLGKTSSRTSMRKKMVEAGTLPLKLCAGITMSHLHPSPFEALEALHVTRHFRHADKDIRALRKNPPFT